MKKIIGFISVLLTCTFLNRGAQAFVFPDFTPLAPFSPQFCVMCIPPAVDWAYNTVDQVKDAKNRLQEMTDVTKIKQALSAYAASLGNTLLNSAMQKASERKNVVSYARTIMESKREGVDINKEDSVKIDFVNLFMQYPSTKSKIKNAYKGKSEALKVDTTLEMYISSSEMMRELCGVGGKGCELAISLGDELGYNFKDTGEMGMMLQISMMEKCLMEGKFCDSLGISGCEPSHGNGNAPAASGQPTEGETSDEDKVCHWKTALQVMLMYDKIMRYNEMLIYMQSQYEAVMGVDTLAKIKAAQEENKSDLDQDAYLMDKYLPQGSYMAANTIAEPLVFADEELSDEDIEEFSKYEKSMAKRENVLKGNFATLNKAEGLETALDGKEDDFASMEILRKVNDALNSAKIYHNMKQMMPDYRGVFKSLRQSEEYHDKTVEYMQASGECIKGYLAPHYIHPASVWFGEKCDYYGKGTVYCHYSPEKSVTDSKESIGLYDDVCPDDKTKKCYVQKLEDKEFNKGLAGVLLAYYNEGKAADALQETQTYLNSDAQEAVVDKEEAKDNSYTSQVTIVGGENTTGDKDSYVTQRDDTAALNSDSASDVLPRASSVQKSVKTERDDKAIDENLKDPQKSDSFAEETRKGNLMNWIWGATVANVISADIDNSVSKFGTRKEKFPLWNDQKEFYDQYIDGKYENISGYMKKAPMPDALINAAQALNTALPYAPIEAKLFDALGHVKKVISVDSETQKTAIAEALGALEGTFDNADNTKAQVDQLITKENNDFAALKANHQTKMANLATEIANLQRHLGDTNTKLDQANTEYNNAGKNVVSAKNTDKFASESEKYSAEIQAKYKTPINVNKSPMNEKFSSEKGVGEALKAKSLAEMKVKELEAKELENTSAILSKLLKSKKEELENERRSFIKEFSNAEENARRDFDKEVSKLQTPVLEDSVVINAMTGAINEASAKLSEALSQQYGASVSISLPLSSVNKSATLVSCLRSKAAEIALQTRDGKLRPLKSAKPSIYSLEASSRVNSIHGEMIDEMMNISDCTGDGVSAALSKEVAAGVFGRMCDKVSCRDADFSRDSSGLINYFVGALPLLEDLKAPTSPVAFSSAPVREIFHFDIGDYESIEKYYREEDMENPSNADITITAEGFLKLGTDMQSDLEAAKEKTSDKATMAGAFPEIWKYVLRRHTYGHKQFDLTKLLGSQELGDTVRGNPDKNYLRSGTFPCKYEDTNKIIDISPVVKLIGFRLIAGDFSYTINAAADARYYSANRCAGLSIKNNKVFDFVADGSPPAGIAPTANGDIRETSELGTILAYVPDAHDNLVQSLFGIGLPTDKSKVKRKLTFNATLQRAVNILSSTEDLGENKDNDAVFYIANRSFFDRNQFGDYLNQIEQENIAKESLMKVQNQIADVLNNLHDALSGTGVIITDDLDLLDEKDYAEVAQALDSQKQIYMNKAKTELQGVKGTSSTIKNKVNDVLNTIALLQEDSDEIVLINGNEDISKLKAQIANKKADNAVGDEYGKMGDEAHQRKLRELQPPYCSVHLAY